MNSDLYDAERTATICDEDDYVLMYWPKNKPIPDGWKFSSRMMGRHGLYSVLIRQIKIGTRYHFGDT